MIFVNSSYICMKKKNQQRDKGDLLLCPNIDTNLRVPPSWYTWNLSCSDANKNQVPETVLKLKFAHEKLQRKKENGLKAVELSRAIHCSISNKKHTASISTTAVYDQF